MYSTGAGMIQADSMGYVSRMSLRRRMQRPCVLLMLLLTSRAASDSLNDIQHFVLFMQENRAFDRNPLESSFIPQRVHQRGRLGPEAAAGPVTVIPCVHCDADYYGMLRGVRGFNDRAAPILPSNEESVWYQPTAHVGPNATSCGGQSCSNQQARNPHHSRACRSTQGLSYA
jgi:hypothetical protein